MSTIEIKSDMFTFKDRKFVAEATEVLHYGNRPRYMGLPDNLAIISTKTGMIMSFVVSHSHMEHGEIVAFIYKAAAGEPKHLRDLTVHLIND